jgi:cytochrome c biogenesis protein CcmG/thiol:disulfide interchange protein DsbE
LVEATHGPAPQFSLPELLDPVRTVTLRSLAGDRVVLNFWQSSCVPCRTEMPLLQSAYVHANGRVRFVGIDTTDERGPAMAFLRMVHVSYLTLFDPHGTAASAYGLYGTPTTVFISPTGTVLGRHIGQLDQRTLAAAMHDAFGMASGT